MATGLLLLGVGRATRLLRYLSGFDKDYEGTARLGVETDTLDAEGTVTRTSPVEVRRNEVEAAMRRFVGEIQQTPPAFSAVKVGGRPLHRSARAGRLAEAPPRTVRVDAFDMVSFDGRDLGFSVTCSEGTYVRALAADLGRVVGCGAHLTTLRRTRIGPYSVDGAPAPADAKEPRSLESALAHMPRVDLPADESEAASSGRALGPAGIEGPYGVYGPDGGLIAVYRDEGSRALPEMVLAPPGVG
jgi:tRNA pseudouridine55 synthase